MSQEDNDRLLRETYQLAHDNNRMLHAMRRNAFIGGVFRILWLAFIIGVPLWIYFTYFQPAVEQFLQTTGEVQNTVQSIPLEKLQQLIDTFL